MKFMHYFSALTGLLLTFSHCLHADNSQTPETGNFLVRAVTQHTYEPALLLGTDIEVNITGPIAKVKVRQQFYNQSDEFVEGKYVFPLPEHAAVNAMTLRIGERVITSEIHEKQQAQQIYQQALQEGKHAGLVEQQRANLFTTQVANIAPKETLMVEITYIETLARAGNEFSFYFPMTLTPRYTPLGSPQTDADNLQSGFIFGQELPAELANPARIRVHIHGAQQVKEIASNSHEILQKEDNNAIKISTKTAYVPMDRDFKLRWKIASDNTNTPVFFVDRVSGDHYGVLMLMPPEHPADETILARETIFIIDTSGSMGGESIEQAKASLKVAIEHLNEHQRFNIIEFNSIHRQLFIQAQQVTADTRQQAQDFIAALQATGGTEMAPALRAALTAPSDPEYLRQVIFITDGAVSNEAELFNIIHQLLGESRLFTVGIGSAPNGYFMKKAAELGRGTQTLISNLGDVNTSMRKLFAQLEKPLLRDLKLLLPDGIRAEIYPQSIPDLYAGEPILLAIKLNAVPAEFTLTGQASSEWRAVINTLEPQNTQIENSGIASLWARAKIESLSERMLREQNDETLKRELIDVALTHRLVSQFTGFVAVEEIVTRTPDSPLASEQIANLLPKGTATTAAYPSTAAGIDLLRTTGLLFLFIFCGLRWRGRQRHA